MKKSLITFAIALAGLNTTIAQASPNLVQNGDFETSSCIAPVGGSGLTCNGGNGQLGYNVNAANWTTTSYSFLFAPGTADGAGANGGANGSSNKIWLWGPGAGGGGVANGLPATSPTGGKYIAQDGGSGYAGPITQTINGLSSGSTYTLSFYYAGAQQEFFDGATTDKWQVTLGNQTQSTNVLSVVNHGFTGWFAATMTFTANASSEVLSFLAVGTPGGTQPPFALLDGVSLTKNGVPEAGTLWQMLIGGLFLMGTMLRRSRKAKAV